MVDTTKQSGYSGTPLAKKLGLKPEMRGVLVDPPTDLMAWLAPLPEGIEFLEAPTTPLDFALVFSEAQIHLVGEISALEPHLSPSGMIWVAWPKKSSGVETDLVFDVVQRSGLDLGLVDNKVCAISPIWSGLRFVVRREKRVERASRMGVV